MSNVSFMGAEAGMVARADGSIGTVGGLVNVRIARGKDGRPYSYHTDQMGQRIDQYTPQQRRDLGETIFMSNQLEYLETVISEQDRPELDGLMLAPIMSDVPTWADSVAFRTSKEGGKAGWVGSAGRNFPRVTKGLTKDIVPMERFGVSAGYDMDEQAAAQAYGMNLDASNALQATRALDEFVHTGVITGYADKKIVGFFGDKNVKRLAASTTIDSSSSVGDILDLLNGVVNQIVIDSNGVEKPNRLAIALDSYTYLANTARSTTSDTTLLTYFAENNPYIRAAGGVNAIVPMASLMDANIGAGLTSVDVMVAYNFDPAKVQLKVTPQQALQVMQYPLETEFSWSQKMSSVMWKKPGSARVMHGI